jgi:hypothetical protein
MVSWEESDGVGVVVPPAGVPEFGAQDVTVPVARNRTSPNGLSWICRRTQARCNRMLRSTVSSGDGGFHPPWPGGQGDYLTTSSGCIGCLKIELCIWIFGYLALLDCWPMEKRYLVGMELAGSRIRICITYLLSGRQDQDPTYSR